MVTSVIHHRPTTQIFQANFRQPRLLKLQAWGVTDELMSNPGYVLREEVASVGDRLTSIPGNVGMEEGWPVTPVNGGVMCQVITTC